MRIYYIGGSPCAGKSTVAEELSRRYGLFYFKVDDYLDIYSRMGAAEDRSAAGTDSLEGENFRICRKQLDWSAEQIWMRNPEIQYKEELIYYREIFGFIQRDLEKLSETQNIITEGAAYLPELMAMEQIPKSRYLSITPTKEFQLFHFRKREFVPYILRDCSDSSRAFQNWMERDILFAEEVRRQCGKYGYVSVVNDGTEEIEAMVNRAAAHFGF